MQTHLVTFAAAAAWLPTVALAHPGHDHAHWLSAPAHALLLLGIIAIGAGIGWILLRQRRRAVMRPRTKAPD